MLDEQVRRHFGEFDWGRDPGWLKRGHAAGRLEIDLHRATAELAKLYPKDVCQEMFAKGNHSGIFSLFLGEGWEDGLAYLLLLGHDLADCVGWFDNPRLVKRLRESNQISSARFEVGIWAGQQRVGNRVTFEPVGPTDEGVDFLVDEGGKVVALEAKALDLSRLQENGHALGDAVNMGAVYGGLFDTPKHKLVLEIEPELAAAARTLDSKEFEDRFAQPTLEAIRDFYSRTQPGALYSRIEVPGIGVVCITPKAEAPSWGVGVHGLEDKGLEHDVLRALRSAKKAASQSAHYAADLRAAVIWASRSQVPAEQAIQGVHAAMQGREAFYRGLDYIVFLNSHRLRGPWTTEVAVCPLPWSAPTPAIARWIDGLTHWRLCQ
jgi:hypothetical protein